MLSLNTRYLIDYKFSKSILTIIYSVINSMIRNLNYEVFIIPNKFQIIFRNTCEK